MPSEEGLAAETLDQENVFGPKHDITVGDRDANFTAHPGSSTYTLSLPNHPDINSTEPSEKVREREPILNENGEEEWYIDEIVAERPKGRGKQYFVSWSGFGPEHNRWLPGSVLAENQALDLWEKKLADVESALDR
ncbi:hypothetical protein K438DRAFT_1666576 [Mycena galopus ATCC 62051]|nr:hypothetical protein K438DRAFT_1666576 [Mycena galopus ATCC 62051]